MDSEGFGFRVMEVALVMARVYTYGSFRKLGVRYFGVLIITRIE